MAIYVLYSLNDAGGIMRSEPIEADSDEAALDKVRALKRMTQSELWLRDRLLGRIPAAGRD